MNELHLTVVSSQLQCEDSWEAHSVYSHSKFPTIESLCKDIANVHASCLID